MTETLSRRGVLQRAFAGAGALFVFGSIKGTGEAAAAWSTPFGYNNCDRYAKDTSICVGGTTTTCRVRFGPPSTCYSPITVYSPSSFYVNTSSCNCSGCGRCGTFQIRAAVTNGGSCSGQCVW